MLLWCALDAVEVALEPRSVWMPGLENDFAADKAHLTDITVVAGEPSEIEGRVEMMFARLLHGQALNDLFGIAPH
jgi:hypothetical protein